MSKRYLRGLPPGLRSDLESLEVVGEMKATVPAETFLLRTGTNLHIRLYFRLDHPHPWLRPGVHSFEYINVGRN